MTKADVIFIILNLLDVKQIQKKIIIINKYILILLKRD